MKNLLFFLILFLFVNTSFSQNFNWITPDKTYLKMYLVEDGMYRINRTDFNNSGINTSSINPRTVKVYNNGIQVPIFFNGEQDGTFDVNDYFDFYGMRNYGGSTKTYDQNNNLIYTTNEYFNQYSDTNVYWIDWGGSNGLRFTLSNYSTVNNYTSLFFNDLLHFEKDYFYSQGENISSSDLRFLNTEKFRGEGWYWKTLYDNEILSDTFSTPLLYTTPQNATIKIFAYPTSRNTSIFNEHSLQIYVNGNLVRTVYSNDINRIDTTFSFSSSLLSNSSVNNVSIKYVPASGFSGSMHLDLFEVQYPKLFKFRNDKFASNLGGVDTTSKLFKISSYNISNPITIYDIYNNIKILTFSNNLDTLKFTGKSNAKFELTNNNITKKPFRIKQKQVPNLVSTSKGADYLLIYNYLFQSQAEQLRSHREHHDNFRSIKAEIEDIYDIFNYGMENPVAIRNFVKYVYERWEAPQLRYICLLGRGSLDPKKILSSSIYYKNYIPVYGYPPSDGYFANVNIGTFFYYNQIAIGRLPAYYPEEAQTMVDKIIAYENESPNIWSKTFTYITGGGTSAEQISHQTRSNFDIDNFILPPSISGEAHKIYRNDTSGGTTYNMKDSVRNDIDRGTFLINYRGHAGSHDWEVAMTDPNTLNNGNMLPVILSLTCFTGEHSLTSLRGFCEKFTYLNNKGSIGFIGTTGWSYAVQGNDFGTHIISGIKLDTLRRLGALTQYAGTKMSFDSLAFSVRHTINCYNLIGDPAVTLKLPVRPEFSITNSNYKLSNNSPTVNENVILTIFPKNYGLFADSCKIRFQLKKNNQIYSFKDTITRNFGLSDSINYNFKIDSIGNYSVIVTLDYSNWYPLENKSNNTATINIPLQSTSFVILKPIDNSVINTEEVEFVGLNPRVSAVNNNVQVMLQFDTTKLFNSPILQTFVNSKIAEVTTKFVTPVPILVDNMIYYLRTNCIINNDSSGWSKSQAFVFSSSFTSASKSNIKGNYDNPLGSEVKIYKFVGNQYSQPDFNNITFKNGGFQLSDYTANLFVRSYGSNAEESSYFSVGNRNVYIDGGTNSGLNMLKVKKVNGDILEFKNLKMTSDAASDSIVTFLNTFDNTHYLMLLNAAYVPGGTLLNSSAKNKLRQFGSIYCDTIGLLSYFHTWSFIGYLGASSSQVSEMFDPCCSPMPWCAACDHWTESLSSMNVTFKQTSGTLSNIVGPAQTWSDFSWTQTLPPNSSLLFDVYGIDKAEQESLLILDIQTNEFTDLSFINAYQYPKLKIVAKFDIDIIAGNDSPIMNAIKVNYSAPSELVLNNNSLNISSSFKTGQDLKFEFNYHNVGDIDIPGVIVRVYKKSISPVNLVLIDTINAILNPDSYRNYKNKFLIPTFRENPKIYFELSPIGLVNEFYSYNNVEEYRFSIPNTYKRSIVEVLSDGQIITNGDYVRQNPELKVNISKSASFSLVSDTSQLSLKLNDQYIPYFINGNVNPLIRTVNDDNSRSEDNLFLFYYPSLENGSNKLTITYKDEIDNMDTITYDVQVSNELLVKDLYNYPNPMREETNFIFSLAGLNAPKMFKIKIYTVSGRLIKEINTPVNIGFNQISWDGRDSDGDFIANGTYLYKLIAEDDSKIETQIEKLVVLR